MTNQTAKPGLEASRQNFELVLSREPFTGLKAILDSLSRDRDALCAAASTANSYEELLAKLGYRVTLTKQIHVQDAFQRLGPAGGIKAVLPYFNIPAKSSLPTLVNFDATVTMTSACAGFFNQMLAAFRAQLSTANQSVSV